MARTTRIALVIPWYGESIPGGAEAACRALVKALLARSFSVEVLTTCAAGFRSDWSRNFHPAGLSTDHGVAVRRFPVRLRDEVLFHKINSLLMRGELVSREEEAVFLSEMISSTALCSYIADHKDEYAFLFTPYMFGTTYWGSQVSPTRSVLIPCLHDESYARISLFRSMFQSVRGVIFLSPEEQQLAQRLYNLSNDRIRVAGTPLDTTWRSDPQRFVAKYGASDFVLFAGRTDKGKNAELLVTYFCRYVDETGSGTKLVLIGAPADIPVPQRHRQRVLQLGYLPQQDKYDCYAAALALCVPSVVESFSIVMMESWVAGTPVIVNGACAVTTGHCRRSNGGLYFEHYDEFREILVELSSNSRLARALGEQGRQYVLRLFNEEEVVSRYLGALREWQLL